jgi:hypothetical protein
LDVIMMTYSGVIILNPFVCMSEGTQAGFTCKH